MHHTVWHLLHPVHEQCDYDMLLLNDSLVYSCVCCRRLSADRAQVWEAALRAHLDMTAAATLFGDANAAPLHDISKRYILSGVYFGCM